MQKSVLRRVKVGAFCAHVRVAAEALPPLLNIEKKAIIKELDVLEGQANAIRKNEHLEKLTKEYVPKLRHIIHILSLQLKGTEAEDENAAAIRNYLNAHFKGRRTTEYLTTWAEGLIMMDDPKDIYSATIFLELKEHTRKMLVVKDLYADEMARIAGIGRTIDTRMRIIDLLFQAMDVAKGARHRHGTRKEAVDALETLETMVSMMKRNLPRRKRRSGEDALAGKENAVEEARAGKENAKEEIAVESANEARDAANTLIDNNLIKDSVSYPDKKRKRRKERRAKRRR